MPNPTGCYLYSDATLAAADEYLVSLLNETKKKGVYLRTQWFQKGIQNIDATELIVLLMNTRRSTIDPKTLKLNGDEWNAEETFILGGVSFMTTGTQAYNNGALHRHANHTVPIETNFIFVAAALLQNQSGQYTADMIEVLSEGKINKDAFYQLYERRLLPGLLMQNQYAKQDDLRLVINIPAIGCEKLLAGNYESQVRELLPHVLKQLFTNHAHSLDMVDTVNFDPYQKPTRDDFSIDSIPGTKIRLMQRPKLGLFEGQPGKTASQLEFPKDGTDYSTGFRLLKIVAWDHFSYPGNDIWQNKTIESGFGRVNDAGVSVASSDVILALSKMGHFGQECAIADVYYIPLTGIVYPKNPSGDSLLSYHAINQNFFHTVSSDMLQLVKLPQVACSSKDCHVISRQSYSSFFKRPVIKSGLCALLSAVGLVAMATTLICSLTPMSIALTGLVIAAICLSISAYALYNDFFQNDNAHLTSSPR